MPQNDWIRRFHVSEGAHVRLVCLPHAGGSAAQFFWLSKALAPHIEALAVQYPGRQDRRHEPFLSSIEELADAIFVELADWRDRPLALFGHSMGAVLAFEVARRLQDQLGQPPFRIFVSGRRAPSLKPGERFHAADDESLIAQITRLNGTDPRVLADDEMLRLSLPVIRNDYRVVEMYRCGPDVALTSPISVLIGDSDPHSTVEEARAWDRHTRGECTATVFPGGHFFLDNHRAAVAQLILDDSAVGSWQG
ncbi:thioesterase [Frankia sp. AgB1.9]|uniref:thioesterase II family protein n=1 Tax=unclassified Frankia TaxID=2632575 RepID=UPI00193446B1|nr:MULTISPECIES: alpha/beta fold hydrolase [unclassified Frankia]MBL7492297.1 thioesterase [Frankia sp. AgW1.1]MBL7551116.1 thioesterase [Frankia sp. AgB1.9]MBL7621885.1 thioesterase [Frankia sp. AgB1.8]